MKRPSDQAKLLFLGLLKTVSALATEPRGAVAVAAATASSSWHTMKHHHHHHHALWRRGVMTTSTLSSTATAATATSSLTDTSWKTPQGQTSSSSNNNNDLPPATTLPPLTLRLAQRTDVPSMQRCNLATLPENYNGAFYVQHMRNWPELALVVVVEDEDNNNKHRRDIGSNSGLSFSPFPTNTHLQQDPPQQVVAYVLGKVEERTVERNLVAPCNSEDDNTDEDGHYDWLHQRLSAAATSSSQQQQQHQTIYETQHIGHITSLAVLQDYRRQGLAQALMEQLHVQLQRHYTTASQVGLHVRQSNKAATALYHGFGYAATECIPRYYQDGEDAYYMMKDLKQQQQQQQQQTNINNNDNDNNNSKSMAMSTASQQARGGGGGGGLFGQYWRQRQQAQAAAAAAQAADENKRQQDDPWAMPRSVGQSAREEEPEEQLMTGTY